nr:PilC/PilY family type IV pilus protein [uncultured Rhodoferax sp.]
MKTINNDTEIVNLSSIAFACILMCFFPSLSHGEQLLLSTIPAGSGGREPAPNVIVSVDDSGSMAWDINTDNTTRIAANRKITILKNALKNTFGNGTSNSGSIPDGRIRLAFQAMHDNGEFITNGGAKRIRLGATNSMKPFSGTHRANFNTFIDTLTADNGTPSHDMMMNVAAYMNAPAHISNPWADNPGTAQTTPYLACRRTYHVFLTDGAWNSQADTQRTSQGDGVSRTLPNGTVYDKNAATSKVYKDNYGDDADFASTLSDLAFANWSKDMQDGNAGTSIRDSAGTLVTGNTQNMANTVRPLIKKAGAETFATTACTSASNCIATPEFWNPKNDPATWQHITQYTIGFGIGAVNWPNTASTPVDWDNNNTARDNYGGDFSKLVQGAVTWGDVAVDDLDNTPDVRTSELWHMAINGRGKFYPAKTANDLDAAFTEILNTVIGDTSRPLVSIATSSSRLGTDVSAFIAGFNADKYSGSLVARPLNSSTGSIESTVTWSASSMLDAITTANLTNRFVYSYNGTTGINWKTYSNLPSTQQTELAKNSSGVADSNGQNRVDYIRGDRSKEIANTGGIFRDRDSRLGDIVNSNLWYIGKPASGYSSSSYITFRGTGTNGKGGRLPVVYVGANDGMLHGFAAQSWPTSSPTIAGGKEVMAYIPQGVAEGNLRKLTYTNYTHNYFVDGTPITGDAEIGTTPTWKTVLFGTLGLGGKGYFLLDVTDPANFTESNVSSLVITDTTASTDADIGYITSPPIIDNSYTTKSRQIVKLNDGKWAVITGNGYNSTNEAPVLFIQYLDGTKGIKKLSPCGFPIASTTCAYKGTNGLSTPQPIDLNGDGKVDVVYAGDLKGNIWKFDITSSTSADWKVSFSNSTNLLGRPFFIAKQGNQSFTSAPFWMSHPQGGISIAIATGRNITDADQSDTTSTQTLYSLWDNSSYSVNASTNTLTISDATPINTATDTGIPSTLVQQTTTSTATVDGGNNYYASSSNSVDYSTKRGWYLNWAIAGQRNIQNIRLFEGQKILVQTMIPKTSANANQETCSLSATAERNFLTIVNMFSGKPPADAPFTLTDTRTSNTSLTTLETLGGDTTMLTTDGKNKFVSSRCAQGENCPSTDTNISKYTGSRGNWQQLQ